MSADWDCASDNLAPRAKRQPGSATMALINAVVWLIVFPVFFVRGLRNGRSTTGDDAGQSAGADWAKEGSFETHNDGCNAA